MRYTAITLASVIVLAGCATASKTHGPDGREAYAINCSGAALNWGMCYSKAGALCGSRGYEVINQDDDAGFMFSANRQFGAFGTSVINRSLLVTCK